MYDDIVIVKGARVHNLKNIDINVPLGRIVAISGVSGSGKSSLALGVLYSEGSRRYLDALSTYTRRRITQSRKADVESVEHLPAALALHQRPTPPNIRSTFATSTELLNSLRLLYSRCGSYLCPNGHYVEASLNVARGLEIECPVCHERFWGLSAEEYSFNSDGACPECSGTGFVRDVDDDKLVGDESKTLEDGAVESWNMFGIGWMYRMAGELGVRTDVPFKELTDKEKDIIFNGEPVRRYIVIPSKNGKMFELNCEYRNAHKAVVEALNKAKTEKGLDRINKYLSIVECNHCNGTRLNARANSTLLNGISLSTACRMTLDDIVEWIETVPDTLPDNMCKMADDIIDEFMDDAKVLLDLGLGYICLDRPSSTLSTGELQRVQLAKTLKNQTTGVLYVLDEPSIGLHPSNIDGLISVMKRLVGEGNSIVIVDHDTQILKIADHMIEMGPGAGSNGGNIIAEGSINEIIENDDSLIGGFLSGSEDTIIRDKSLRSNLFDDGCIELSTNEVYNVKKMDIRIPKERLTVITGVSGSGKTTLLLECLYPAVKAIIDKDALPTNVNYVDADGVTKIELIDSVPIGKNVRSTVATYSKVLDDLRKAFSKLDDSITLNYKASDFSYNTGKLRCKTCNGTGTVSMDVQFLPDVEMPCPDCGGRRYSNEADRIKHDGLSIADIMELTVDEAIDSITLSDRITNKLGKLSNLGLGYLTLGESTPSLSGGEAQRLKLASEMGKSQKNSVFIFDEPSIGLHPLDIKVLLNVFERLLDEHATVIVIEHDLDVIRNADYIIDMGIDDDNMGGDIVVSGTLEDVTSCDKSLTANYLK